MSECNINFCLLFSVPTPSSSLMKTCLLIASNEDTRKICVTSATTKPAFTCSKLTIKTLEQGVRNVAS